MDPFNRWNTVVLITGAQAQEIGPNDVTILVQERADTSNRKRVVVQYPDGTEHVFALSDILIDSYFRARRNR